VSLKTRSRIWIPCTSKYRNTSLAKYSTPSRVYLLVSIPATIPLLARPKPNTSLANNYIFTPSSLIQV